MTEIQTTHYSRYHVRPGRWQALRHALTGRGFELDGSRVSPVIPFAVGTQRVRVEAWGSGGSGGTGSPYQVIEMNGETRITGGGGNGGTGTPGAAGSGGAGSEPARGGPGRHRRIPVQRLCCKTADGQPHADCPVYTPGGYARLAETGTERPRDCCNSLPGTDHDVLVCRLSPGQRAALADHEALAGPHEPRLAAPRPSGQPWHCTACGAGLIVVSGRLAHPDPLCLGITPEQIDAAARDARPEFMP